MLSVLGLDVQLYADSALTIPITGDGDTTIETFVIDPGQSFYARIAAEDINPSSSAPGITGLNLDILWNRDELGNPGGDFMWENDPPSYFGNPLPLGSPVLTAALPDSRQGILDNPQSKIDYLGGDIAPAGAPLGIGVAETFSLLGFEPSGAGVSSTVLSVGLGVCYFADGTIMEALDLDPYLIRIRVNTPPVAEDDDYETDEDHILTGNVLTNDSDIDNGYLLTVTAFDTASLWGAAVSVASDGSFTYDPLGKYHYDSGGNIAYDPSASDLLQALASGEWYDDTFDYTIADEHGAIAIATVTVKVDGLNDPEIVAVKWDDVYGNQVQDSFEARLEGWTVFADLNSNGEWNPASEPDGQTDNDGQFSFEYLLPGKYTIFEIIPDASPENRWVQTTPGPPADPPVYPPVYPQPRELDVDINDPPTQARFGNYETFHVTASSIMQNDVVAAGDLTYEFTFNRNPAPEDWSDPTVWGGYFQIDSLILGENRPITDFLTGVTLTPTGGGQNPSTLTLTFDNLPDDSYRLTLKSGDDGFVDVFGNRLDGERHTVSTVPSGDALDGGDFHLNFVADLDVANYPVEFQAVAPLGSLIYTPLTGQSRDDGYHIDPTDGTAMGYIGPAPAPYAYDPNVVIPADDTDSFFVTLDDYQTITVIVEPFEPRHTDPEDPYIQFHELSPTLELRDPGGALMATLPTAGVFPERLIQTAAIDVAGDYTITVGGIDNTLGAYRLRVILNAAVEEESLGHGGNDEQAQAQDIDPSFIRLYEQVLVIPRTGEIVQDSFAATPFILPGAVSDPNSTETQSPRNHAIMGGVLYYAASDVLGTNEAELWSYDGVTHAMVADINPGAGDSFPSHFAVLNDELYFSAYDPEHGYELWRFDGNAAVRLADINPGTNSSHPMHLTVYNGRLYFSADDGTNGSELWQYVPAAAPSVATASIGASLTGAVSMVQDINRGKFGSLPGPMTVFKDKLYFSADEGIHYEPHNENIFGFELHMFDAFNDAGVVMVKDIHPGMPSSNIQDIIVFGDEMFFRANDGIHGWEAFKYDGVHDPVPLPDLNSASGGSWPGYFTVFRNQLYVVADIEGGGWQLLQYKPAEFKPAEFKPAEFKLAEGTGPGTMMLPDSPTVAGQYLFFSAESTQHGRELWAYDGFELFLVDDFTPGTASTIDNSSPYRGFAALGEELFFRTFDWSGPLRYVPPVATAQKYETTSTRGAVMGRINHGSDPDWYSFTMEDGQTATVALESELPGGTLALDIYHGSIQLPLAGRGVDNLDQIVENILDDTTDGATDTYFVRVQGVVPDIDYRLVITRDATFDAEPNNSPATAQALPPEMTALGNLQAGETDYYTFEAVRGDTILVETSTPADGPGQFVNGLDPKVELFDPENNNWIEKDNNAPDGRNAWVRLRALRDGAYTVRVGSSGGTSGEYVLNVRLNPASGPKPLYITTAETSPANLALTLVAAPTAVAERTGQMAGQVAALPENLAYVSEWDAFHAEVWVRTADADAWLADAAATVSFNTDYSRLVAVEAGPAFAGDGGLSLQNEDGRVTLVGVCTTANVGAGQYTLLARLRFEPVEVGPGVAVGDVGAKGRWIGLAGGSINATADAVGNARPNTRLIAVPFDLDDNGRVDLGDLAFFASAYRQSVADANLTAGQKETARRCDFDGSGTVDLGDLAFFAANYRKDRAQIATGSEQISLTPAWENMAVASTASPVPLDKERLLPVVGEAVARMADATGMSADEIIEGVSITIVDLPGSLIGQTTGRSIQIDSTAAGHGWFVDQTPGDDVEFSRQVAESERSASWESEAAARADLLTAVMHELGHVLGLRTSEPHGLMDVSLPLGARRLLDSQWLDQAAGGLTANENRLDSESLDGLFEEIRSW